MWDVLHRVCSGLGQALVVLLRDVEHTVCSTFERYDAFIDVFGKITTSGSLSVSLPGRQNIVLIGGTSLSDKGPDRAPKTLKYVLTLLHQAHFVLES